MMLTMIRFYINDVRQQVMDFVAESHARHHETIKEHHETVRALIANAGGDTDVLPFVAAGVPPEEKQLSVPPPEATPEAKPTVDLASFNESMESLKQHLTTALGAFVLDLSTKMDASIGKKQVWEPIPGNPVAMNGGPAWSAPKALGLNPTTMPQSVMSQGITQGTYDPHVMLPASGTLPPPPSQYQGVCGSMMIGAGNQRLPARAVQ